jgi:hypothetical protein
VQALDGSKDCVEVPCSSSGADANVQRSEESVDRW